MPESNDKSYEQAMNDIFAIYEQAEKDMLEKVSKRVAKGIKEEGWNEAKLKETQELNKELATLMSKANKAGQKKIAVEVAKGYLKGKHITYKETAEIIKQEGFKIGNGKVSGNTWGKAGYFTDNDEVLDFYGGLMTSGKKNKGKETEIIEQYIKLGKSKKIELNYDADTEAFYGTKDKDMMYVEAAKQLDDDAKQYFFENLKGIEKGIKWHILYDKETGKKVNSILGVPSPSDKEKYAVKYDYYSGNVSNDVKKLFNETVKKYKYDTLQIESNNSYVGYDQTVVLNNKNLVPKEEAEKVVEGALEKMSYDQLLEEAPIPMNLKQLIKATNGLIENASFQILRSADDAYQRVMANATTGLLAGVDTRRQASQKMLNEFASKGITSFVDKAGRNWNLSSYAEMCARTVSQNAARQGHFDRQIEVGEDLVKVSKIGTTCPICQRWQGVVLSISGNHPKYHSVEEAKASGLFHPNCKHIFNMYIEELDGPGKVEPDDYNEATPSSQLYYETQRQRANERKIRYWKKRRALAITPEEELKASENIKRWQYKNLIHCEKHGLRRNYAREGLVKADVNGPKGTLIGGSLKEYEEVFKNVVGQAPKPLFMKLNLQFFANKTYEKWLKDEIASLDELDVDKAMLKDASNKNVTPTSLYKKYIGDNPGQDYAEVSQYEKGTKEYKSGYAKWLKQQVEEIGVTYKVKPKYVEVHEDIPDEDKSLSATNIYKKYHDGKAPTEAYKEAGGEAGTGMKYGKWVETQKKELIKNGITKTVPFGNVVAAKTTKAISDAKPVITDAKLLSYKNSLDILVTGAYSGSQAVKAAYKNIQDATTESEKEFAKQKYEIAKAKHIEMIKKKAESLYGTKGFKEESDLLYDQLMSLMGEPGKEEVYAHVKAQYEVYTSLEDTKKKEAAKLKTMQDAVLKKKSGLKSGDALELLNEDEAEIIARSITKMPKKTLATDIKKTHECWEHLIQADGKLAEDAVEEYKKMEQSGVSMESIQRKTYDDMRYKFSKHEETLPLAAAYDYTVGAGVYNRYKWGEVDKYTLSSMHYFMCNSTTGMDTSISNYEYGKKMSKYYDQFFERVEPVKEAFNVKRLIGTDGLAPMLGLDKGATMNQIKKRVKEYNAMKGQGIIANAGFTSTSTYHEGDWSGNVGMAIKVNPGTKAVYGEAFSHYQHGKELETLLKAGQPLRVIKIYEYGDDGYNEIRKEMGYRYDAGAFIVVCETIPE